MRALALTIALVTTVASGQAQTPAPDAQLEAFLTELQRAVASGDRQAVAAMIRYPLTVSIAGVGLRVPINDAADFLARYDDILTEPLRDEIARASVLPQSARPQVGATPAALSIGSNLILIERVDGRPQIVSIAVPQVEGGGADRTASASSSAPIPRAPRRVSIRVGPRPTQVAGSLAIDAIDSYLVFVPKGQTLGVRLERVPPGTAAIRVAHGRTGAPLNPKMAEGRFVSGMAADGAEYRIEVRRLSCEDAAPVPYMLSLTLR